MRVDSSVRKVLVDRDVVLLVIGLRCVNLKETLMRVQEVIMSTTDRSRTTGGPPIGKDALRSFNKRFLNPAMMRIAGRKFVYAAVIRHTGRRSGTAYATPVVADRTGNSFVIPLPYGTGTDWLRNVQAAGHATLQVRGETYEVAAPEIIDAATALPQVPAAHARVWQRLRIKHYLTVVISTDKP